MKFTAKKGMLQDALQVFSGLINVRNPLHMLTHVRCEVKKNLLHLAATDLTISATLTLPVTDGEDGGVTVPFDGLLNDVRVIPQAEAAVTVSSDAKNHIALKVAGRRSSMRLIGGAIDEFPTLEAQAPQHTFTLPADLLGTLIASTAFAASGQDETRAYLTGLNVVSKDGQLAMVATNSHKLALRRTAWPKKADPGAFNIVVPAKAMLLLGKNLAADTTPVEIGIATNHASFRHGALQLTTRLIDEEYPAYEKVIPAKPLAHRILIDPLVLGESVQLVSPACDDKTRQVHLTFADTALTVSAVAGISGKDNSDTIEVDAPKGTAVEVAFNLEYLREILARFSEGQLEFQITDAAHPCVFLNPQESGLLCLLMPVRN